MRSSVALVGVAVAVAVGLIAYRVMVTERTLLQAEPRRSESSQRSTGYPTTNVDALDSTSSISNGGARNRATLTDDSNRVIDLQVIDFGNHDERQWKYSDANDWQAAKPSRPRPVRELIGQGGPSIIGQTQPVLNPTIGANDDDSPLGSGDVTSSAVLPGPGMSGVNGAAPLSGLTPTDLELAGPEHGVVDRRSTGPTRPKAEN